MYINLYDLQHLELLRALKTTIDTVYLNIFGWTLQKNLVFTCDDNHSIHVKRIHLYFLTIHHKLTAVKLPLPENREGFVHG